MREKKLGKVTSSPPGPIFPTSCLLVSYYWGRSGEERNDDVIRKAKRKGCQAKGVLDRRCEAGFGEDTLIFAHQISSFGPETLVSTERRKDEPAPRLQQGKSVDLWGRVFDHQDFGRRPIGPASI